MFETNDAGGGVSAVDHAALSDELVEILFQNVPLVIVPSVLVGGLVIALLYPYVDTDTLILWSSVIAVILFARALVYAAWRLELAPAASNVFWARVYTGATFVAGVAWGALPVIFMDAGEPVTFIGICMTLVGVSAGTIALYSSWPAAYIAFTTPTLLMLSFTIMMFGQSFIIIGAMGLVAYGIYLGLALLSWSRLRRSVLMQFHNHELALNLGAEKERAESASRAKSQLLAAISHDLRQPLQSVRLYTDLLRQKSTNSETDDLYEKVEHSIAALTGMFNQLLDMSRMDAREVDVNMQRVDLEHLAERVYSQFIPIADHKGIDLEVDCPDIWGWADPVLLGRVLDNLVSNALRYTEEGDVCVVFDQRGAMIEIDVLDSGPGIPATERQRVFDEFYQLHNESRQRSEGLGIGLAIVHRLCKLMNIEVKIMSTEGGGTRVHLRLPATGPDRTPEPEKSESLATDCLAGCHVMVVEDDPEVRIAMETTLSTADCRVSSYASGETALAGLDPNDRPAIVVSDIRLPGNLDGHAVVEAVRQRVGRRLPAVLITSGPGTGDLGGVPGQGPEILLKPVHAETLLASVARCVVDRR
ncbi:MAG: ATP-binding protein [Halofilum sp. (in: g-proteobacteria)]|nr:ATP-binding protein [Halofilum sp. (in: g-proteobacteria)]